MWTHTVLEIYQALQIGVYDGDRVTYTWPTNGEPADWIEQGLVGYTQGRLEDVVILTPLWQLLWWKLKGVFQR